MRILVSARLQATAAPEAPEPMMSTSTRSVMSKHYLQVWRQGADCDHSRKAVLPPEFTKMTAIGISQGTAHRATDYSVTAQVRRLQQGLAQARMAPLWRVSAPRCGSGSSCRYDTLYRSISFDVSGTDRSTPSHPDSVGADARIHLVDRQNRSRLKPSPRD